MFVVISILSWQFSTFYKHIYPAYCVTFAIFAPTGENETRNDYFKCSVCYLLSPLTSVTKWFKFNFAT